MKHPYNYRNKVQLPVRNKNGLPVIGFFAQRSHDIIEMDKCFIQDEICERIIDIIKEWIIKYKIAPYDEEKGIGILRHIMIRKAFKTGEIMVVLVTNTETIPYKDEIVNMLKKIDGIKSIIQNINLKKLM